MWVCVCVYLWAHVCVVANVVRVCLCACVGVYGCFFGCGCMGVGACVGVCAYLGLGACVVHVCVCSRVCVRVLLRVWECVRVCLRVCMLVQASVSV